MNNQTVTYYVTVDANNYVLSASSEADNTKRKVNIPLDSLTDFNIHMNLYQVDEQGKINFPDFKAATLADEISTLKSTADEQSATIAQQTKQLQVSQTMINQLLVTSAVKGAK